MGSIAAWIAFTLVFLISAPNVLTFSYEDLKNITRGCSQRATCKVTKSNRLDMLLDWKAVNCFCDDLCINYGDCCLDAAVYDPQLMKKATKRYECINVNVFGSYYMKGTCANDLEDVQLRELCSRASPGISTFSKDPFIDTPVTSLSSDITYKNYYCAVCNNEDLKYLSIWSARVSCPYLDKVDSKFVRENVAFVNGSWGIRVNVNSTFEGQFHNCDIYPQVPETVIHKIRPCENFMSGCSLNWTDLYTEELCSTYTTVVYGSPPKFNPEAFGDLSNRNDWLEPVTYSYRNYHCAKCNFVEDQHIQCYERDFRTGPNFAEPMALNVLFDFGIKASVCNVGQIYDRFTESCREVVCLKENYQYRNGRCIKIKSLISIIHSPISTTTSYDIFENLTSINETDISINSTKAAKQKCDRMLLNESDFSRGPNGSLIVKSYRRTYEENEYEEFEGGVLVCIPSDYSRLMGWLTLVGLGVSCLCIVIHLIAFVFLPELRNLSGKNLASMCLALLSAYLCFLISTFREDGSENCIYVAYLMYYFFMASFTWMNVMAFDIWRTLQLATTELRISGGKQWSKFIYYSLYAWVFPAIALSVVVSIDFTKPDAINPFYYPQLGERFCWFGQRQAILIYFAAPLAFFMMLNIIFFLLAVRMVSMTTGSTSAMATSKPQRVQLKLYLKLALLMGLSWISGIVAGYIQVEYVWYLFILLNAFQGLYILLGFACTSKVYKAVRGPSRKSDIVDGKGPLKKAHLMGRNGLVSQDSNNSNLSNVSSSTQLSTNLSRSSIDSHKL